MKEREEFFQMSRLEQQRAQQGKVFLEFLRAPAMSAGVTRTDGCTDPQKPPQRRRDVLRGAWPRAHAVGLQGPMPSVREV